MTRLAILAATVLVLAPLAAAATHTISTPFPFSPPTPPGDGDFSIVVLEMVDGTWTPISGLTLQPTGEQCGPVIRPEAPQG